jgi:hypothetical protein
VGVDARGTGILERAMMSTRELKTLLDDVPDTLDIVLRRSPLWSPELAVWRDAVDDAACALAAWREAPGDRMAYAAYRAAQDREDAAQDALVYSHTSRISVS